MRLNRYQLEQNWFFNQTKTFNFVPLPINYSAHFIIFFKPRLKFSAKLYFSIKMCYYCLHSLVDPLKLVWRIQLALMLASSK